MNHFLLVAAGGAIGAALRHGVGVAALRMQLAGWPWATFTVNILGSLLMGLAVGWFAFRGEGGQAARLFVTTGILGGFTTFSAFSLEVFSLMEKGETVKAVGYAVGSVVLGVVALAVGLLVARKVLA